MQVLPCSNPRTMPRPHGTDPTSQRQQGIQARRQQGTFSVVQRSRHVAEMASPVVLVPFPHSANAAVALRMDWRCAGVVDTPRSVQLMASSRSFTAPVLARA